MFALLGLRYIVIIFLVFDDELITIASPFSMSLLYCTDFDMLYFHFHLIQGL